MEREVTVGRRDATLVVSRRLQVRLSEIGDVLGSSFGEVYGYLGTHGVEPQGPPFVIYHSAPVGDDPFDVEVCAPVVRAPDAPAGWRIQELPGGCFATLLHVGPYSTVKDGYDTMMAWLVGHDASVIGPPREVYLSEGDTPPDKVQTIIEFPVAEAALPLTAR
jgi:effector-binding domain-containing protein